MAKRTKGRTLILDWNGEDLKKALGDVSNDAMFRGGNVLLDDATDRAPERTGALKRSGYVSTSDHSTYKAHRGYKREVRPKDKGSAVIAFSAPHSHLVEGGTKHSRPNPFLRPALDGSADEIVREIARIMGRVLE